MIEVGQIYTVRCVESGEEAWRRLLVVGEVPARSGEATTCWAVQQPGLEMETRDILAVTLKADCDLEL